MWRSHNPWLAHSDTGDDRHAARRGLHRLTRAMAFNPQLLSEVESIPVESAPPTDEGNGGGGIRTLGSTKPFTKPRFTAVTKLLGSSGRCFEFGFLGSDEPFSRPLLHYGVWDKFSPQKNNTQKNTDQSMNMKTKIHVKKTRLSLQLVPAMTILVALALSIPMSAQTVTTFDAPGAGTGPFQGTFAFNIAPSGTIVGSSSRRRRCPARFRSVRAR